MIIEKNNRRRCIPFIGVRGKEEEEENEMNPEEE
jgi:hypothetical protein